LSRNCRFWRTFAWAPTSADPDAGGAQIFAHRHAMHAGRTPNALQRPSQATKREDLLLFVWLQDVAHLGEGLHIRRLRQRLGCRQLNVGFEVSTKCRFWVSAEAPQ